MCECRPEVGAFWEFTPLLFNLYDMAVEFARRQDRAAELLTERWPEFCSKTDDYIVRHILDSCLICPLSLRNEDERLIVERSGTIGDTGEPCYFFRLFVSFEGDAELWNLFPAKGMDNEVAGEIYCCEFVVGVLDVDQASAMRDLRGQIWMANCMIELQRGRITAFNEALPSFVRREISRRRAPHKHLH